MSHLPQLQVSQSDRDVSAPLVLGLIAVRATKGGEVGVRVGVSACRSLEGESLRGRLIWSWSAVPDLVGRQLDFKTDFEE